MFEGIYQKLFSKASSGGVLSSVSCPRTLWFVPLTFGLINDPLYPLSHKKIEEEEKKNDLMWCQRDDVKQRSAICWITIILSIRQTADRFFHVLLHFSQKQNIQLFLFHLKWSDRMTTNQQTISFSKLKNNRCKYHIINLTLKSSKHDQLTGDDQLTDEDKVHQHFFFVSSVWKQAPVINSLGCDVV